MKIVHVITRLIVGGAQENTLLSCEGQHDAGHEVTLVTGPALGPEGSLMLRARDCGYRVLEIDDMRRAILPFKDYRAYRSLIDLFDELKPDVVHTHSSKAGIIGRWAAHRAKVPAIIHTIHGLAFTASTKAWVNEIYKWLERKTAPITTRIVCVADAMRDQSLAANIGTPEQYVTVYSGMETQAYLDPPIPRPEVRRQLGLSEDHLAVGTIARLFHMKGHEDLIALAPALCREHPNLRFLWVGDGILRPDYERQIAQMGLQDRFILTGLVPPARIPEVTNAMDILVHPSRREGLARALPQGALAGKPVVTYDVDGNAEAVVEGRTGFVIQPFDVVQLGRKLDVLLNSADLREAFGREGRAFAQKRWDAKVMVEELEKVYQSALGTARC